MEDTDKPSWRQGWGRMVVWMTAGALVALCVIFVAAQADALDRGVPDVAVPALAP